VVTEQDVTMLPVPAHALLDGSVKTATKDVMSGHGERTARSNVNVPTVLNAIT